MSEREIDFIVYCDPVPQGSMKHVGMGRMIHQNEKELKAYRKALSEVADKFHDAMWTDNHDMGYEVSIIFYIEAPKSPHRAMPTVRGTGDLDKLVRAVLDALTRTVDKKTNKVKQKGIWDDDAQVVRIKATKYYVNDEYPKPSTYIHIRKVLKPKAMSQDNVGQVFDDDV